MHAVRLYEYGGPEVVKYVEVPRPDVGPRDVLIRVRATAITSWDLRYRQGKLTAPPGRAALPLPFQLGREAAGEVAAVGAEVTRFKVGQRVLQMTCPACGHCEYCRRGLDNLCIDTALPGHQKFGGYAEYVSCRETEVLPAPDGVPFEKLACCLWSYATVHGMAIGRAKLQPGEDVLITAASSGMGTAALQIARAAGARLVFGTTGSPDKAARLKALGFDHVIDYRREDVPARVRALAGRDGIDVVLESVGTEQFKMALPCLTMGGRIVIAGNHGGNEAAFSMIDVYRRQISILGHRAATRRDQETVVALMGKGMIDPVVDRVMKLSEAAAAHTLLESGQVVGKIVLVP